MMNELQKFSNEMFSILIKQEKDNNLFDLETVAKSLGFTQIKNGKQYIRWETINKYLENYLSQKVGKGDFIPEAMVYKLAFKAGNSVAENFQDWLAMEVLPTIRKTGTYQSKPMTNAEKIKYIAQGTEELDERVTAIEKTYPIMPGEARHIQTLVKRKVAEVVRNNFNGYYQEVSKKLFSEIYKSIKKIFKVPTYTSIPRGRYREAIQFIEEWQPSYDTTYQLEMSLK